LSNARGVRCVTKPALEWYNVPNQTVCIHHYEVGQQLVGFTPNIVIQPTLVAGLDAEQHLFALVMEACGDCLLVDFKDLFLVEDHRPESRD
jgi:hypothetical protein